MARTPMAKWQRVALVTLAPDELTPADLERLMLVVARDDYGAAMVYLKHVCEFRKRSTGEFSTGAGGQLERVYYVYGELRGVPAVLFYYGGEHLSGELVIAPHHMAGTQGDMMRLYVERRGTVAATVVDDAGATIQRPRVRVI